MEPGNGPKDNGRYLQQTNNSFLISPAQVSNAAMASSDPPNPLTKFIRNIEPRVFADMQSAPPQEMNEKYGLPKEGRPDIPNA